MIGVKLIYNITIVIFIAVIFFYFISNFCYKFLIFDKKYL